MPPPAGLRELSPVQWRSGAAAWLGWLFDGLDMHLYTLVATKFVGELLGPAANEGAVSYHAGIIQAAFLVGWALGGGCFGLAADRIGRSKALALTILTYAVFTGLSFCATAWWHLLIFRFVAALGIGGEWAVGASLLSETWPARWRPWLAAVLQSAVNLGVLLACGVGLMLASQPPRYVFLVGVAPALIVFWIRKAVPEPVEWQDAAVRAPAPRLADLFRGELARTTWTTLAVCATALTAHWAYVFWSVQHLKKVAAAEGLAAAESWGLAGLALMMVGSIVGNFLAGWLAKARGYPAAIAGFCLAYAALVAACYATPRTAAGLLPWFFPIGAAQGVFALFTMYLPGLFPTLLRATGAGFCYNFGRLAAAAGTVVFGIVAKDRVDAGAALFWTSALFLPPAALAFALARLPNRDAPPN